MVLMECLFDFVSMRTAGLNLETYLQVQHIRKYICWVFIKGHFLLYTVEILACLKYNLVVFI